MAGNGDLITACGGTGPPLWLIHGLAGSKNWWDRNIPAFSEHYTVFAVNLPGFGENWSFDTFHIDSVIDLLVATLRDSHRDPVRLVGHSLGGVVAGVLASRFPELVHQLVLVDAAFLSYEPNLADRISGLVRSVRQVPADFVPMFLDDLVHAGTPAFATASYELLFKDWTEAVESIAQPTLVSWGKQDHIVPVSIGAAIHRDITGSVFDVIDGAGHNPMWDRPMNFNQAVLDFLDASSGVGS